jgi:hypothetical protein
MKTLAVRGMVTDLPGSDAIYVSISQNGPLPNVWPTEIGSRGDTRRFGRD